MKVQDVILMAEIINDKTNVIIYENAYEEYEDFNDFNVCLDGIPSQNSAATCGEWFTDRILYYAERTVKHLEYHPEENICSITIGKERED